MCGPLLPIFNLSVRFYQKVSEKLRGSTTFKSFISKNIAIPCLAGLSCMQLKETGSDLCQDLQTLIRHSTQQRQSLFRFGKKTTLQTIACPLLGYFIIKFRLNPFCYGYLKHGVILVIFGE